MNNEIQNHLDFLGFMCKDKITGMEGVVTSVSFDLYGCIQAILHPGLNEKGETMDTRWFDICRIEKIKNARRVMMPPDFISGAIAQGKKGPAEKPTMNKN